MMRCRRTTGATAKRSVRCPRLVREDSIQARPIAAGVPRGDAFGPLLGHSGRYMPSSSRPRWPARRGGRRLPKPDRRRALELLARCGAEGCTEALMFANGFTAEML